MVDLFHPGVRAGAEVQTTALPVGQRARSDGSVATYDVTAGQDMVPEPTLHAEASDAAAGGRQSPRRRPHPHPANHERVRPKSGRGLQP